MGALSLGLPLQNEAASLFRFDFDEGAGNTVTNTAGTLTGVLGQLVDTPVLPLTNGSTPAGTVGERSLTLADPDGFLVLDGTNAPALSAIDTPITAEAWIFIPEGAIPRYEAIVGYGDTWKLGLTAAGEIAFTLRTVADVSVVGLVPPIGVWTHVATVWEPGVGVTFYVDGVDSGFVAETRGLRAPVTPYLGIGGNGALSEPLNGSIDRVRVHRAVLTADQLDSVAASPKAPLATTIVSLGLNEEAAPYANAGTLGGSGIPAQPVIVANVAPKFVTDSPTGKAGDFALSFDNTDLLRVEDPAQVVSLVGEGLTGDFTVQVWVKPGAIPNARAVLFGSFGPGGALSFSLTSDRKIFVTTYGIADIPTQAGFPNDGLWHHLAVVHTAGQNLKFYVDGVLGDTLAYSNGLNTRAETWFWIGSEFAGGLRYVGLMDRLQLATDAVAPKDLDYLAIPGVIPGTPELEIGTAVSVAWPTTGTGFILQSTTDLVEPKTWVNVSASPTVVGEKYYTLLPITETKTFYRLFRPDGP